MYLGNSVLSQKRFYNYGNALTAIALAGFALLMALAVFQPIYLGIALFIYMAFALIIVIGIAVILLSDKRVIWHELGVEIQRYALEEKTDSIPSSEIKSVQFTAKKEAWLSTNRVAPRYYCEILVETQKKVFKTQVQPRNFGENFEKIRLGWWPPLIDDVEKSPLPALFAKWGLDKETEYKPEAIIDKIFSGQQVKFSR
jgi:hypothetical protein